MDTATYFPHGLGCPCGLSHCWSKSIQGIGSGLEPLPSFHLNHERSAVLQEPLRHTWDSYPEGRQTIHGRYPQDCPCAESRLSAIPHLAPWKDQGLSAAQVEHRSQEVGLEGCPSKPDIQEVSYYVKAMGSFTHPPSTRGIEARMFRGEKGAIDLDLDIGISGGERADPTFCQSLIENGPEARIKMQRQSVPYPPSPPHSFSFVFYQLNLVKSEKLRQPSLET